METKIDWDSVVTTEIDKRNTWASSFLKRVFDIEESWQSDEARITDFFQESDTQDTVRLRTVRQIGFLLFEHHFSIPFWQLLDEVDLFFKKVRPKRGSPETEILQNENAIDYFLEHVFEVGAYINDLITLGDHINTNDRVLTEIIENRIYRVYGTRMMLKHYELPIWKLIEELEANCLQSEPIE
jgi:hypothetical protein